MYFGEFLRVPKPDNSIDSDRYELVLLVIEFQNDNFIAMSINIATLVLDCLINYIDSTLHS